MCHIVLIYNWTLPVFSEKLRQFKVYINLSFHDQKASDSIKKIMFAHAEWAERGSASRQFVWTRGAEAKANKRPEESTVGIWSLGCANRAVLTSCQNPVSKLVAVLCFQTPDRQLISVIQPIPDIQVAWKLVSEAVSFSRCNALVFVLQEQSEDEQLILVLLFHAKVLWVCFVVLVFLNSHIFKTRSVFKTPLLFHRVPYFCKLPLILRAEVIKLNLFMQLARKFMSCKTSSYRVTMNTHLLTHTLDSNFIHAGPGTTAILQHLKPNLVSEIPTASLAPPI